MLLSCRPEVSTIRLVLGVCVGINNYSDSNLVYRLHGALFGDLRERD
jgi:hypothetical protein